MPSIRPLATLEPSCNARVWHSTPHPHLPIIATSCADKTVRVYSLRTFQQESSITGGHKRSIRCSAWKPNSVGESVLATGSFDASAGIWRRWEEGGGKGGLAEETDFTAGLAGGGEGEDDDDDDEEWKFAVVLDGHDSEIKSLAFAPTAPLLATCSRDKSVWIWEELEDDNFETVAVLQEHEGDVKCVAWHPNEELLASGSYDDNIRLWREDLDDWACCALLNGHAGTVWWVEFEGSERVGKIGQDDRIIGEQKSFIEAREKSGPRLVSCSDDHTVRIWRRVPKNDAGASAGQSGLPSIWKNKEFEEQWLEEGRLPPVHDSPVYAVSWSKKTGLISSAGCDGKIVLYEERWPSPGSTLATPSGDTEAGNGLSSLTGRSEPVTTDIQLQTEWVVVAEIDNAHDVFEVNHITWAPRADKGKRYESEEILVSTGDDGQVKLWTFDP